MMESDLYKILISDTNIYKAILSVDSYIFNPQLIDNDDIELYYELKDKFNYNKYFISTDTQKSLIEEIRQIIKRIIENNNELFTAKVYFKLKKPESSIYRPLHIASLKDSIAIVAMLQVLIFDMKSSNETKMKLSNLAKMIPSNFYGNIPSRAPERLFEKWQDKYKEYSKRANEKFSEYENSEKYKFEVTLDLINFFPSINPLLVYNFIVKALKIKFRGAELELIKKITFKLLFFKIEAYENEDFKFFRELYYTDSSKNSDFEEIKRVINDKTIYLTKGIPQGLPQAYFFGNLIMIKVAEIYDQYFKGEALYYVDDSYIYTNVNITDTDFFKEKLDKINDELEKYSSFDNGEINVERLPYNEEISYFKNKYIIKVHNGDKSSYLSVKDTKTGYKYLKFLSRLASMGSFDFKTTFSDYEEIKLKEKFSILIKAIDEEMNLCCKASQAKNGCKEHDSTNYYDKCTGCSSSKECNDFFEYKEYLDKLKRFKRFFQFRVLMIKIEESGDVMDEILKELEKLKKEEVGNKLDEDLFEIKLNVLEDYLTNSIDNFEELSKFSNNDRADNPKLKDIKMLYNKVKEFEIYFAKKSNIKYTNKNDYFYYYKVFNNNKRSQKKHIDIYKSISNIISKKVNMMNKHYSYQKTYLNGLLEALQKNQIVEYAFNISNKDIYNKNSLLNEDDTKYKIFSYWSIRSKYLRRYIINTIISLILNVELNENLYVSRCNKKPLNYFELRLVTAARNKNLDLSLIIKILQEYFNARQVRILDYTIFEAIYYFRIFAREPKYIDNLILIHKYTTELWENGSKYMHFYTLHNQSHAVELIKNINSFIKAIDYFKISKIDYYILYIACYLHDISMVIYPRQDRFLSKDFDEANSISASFIEKLKSKNSYELADQQGIKELLLDTYKEMDEMFEREVRNNHAKDSASYIRKSNDLSFIEEAILDFVADVAYSHGIDTRDVYHIKGSANDHLISKKFMMILIRLADLFDMSESRVSIPLLYNNKENMSLISRFHWISHLVTGDFKISNDYSIDPYHDINSSYFKPKTIHEVINIEINIKFNQMTTIDNKETCKMVCMEDYKVENEIVLNIKTNEEKCKQQECNFLCKWFMKKNAYMINELHYLQGYLEDVQNYFKTSFNIKLKLNDSNILRTEDFDDLKSYISID